MFRAQPGNSEADCDDAALRGTLERDPLLAGRRIGVVPIAVGPSDAVDPGSRAPRGLATRGPAEEQWLLRQPPGTLRVRASALSCGRFRCRSTDTLSPSRRGLYRRNSKQEGI